LPEISEFAAIANASLTFSIGNTWVTTYLRVLIEQPDGGVDLVVEAKGAPQLYLLRH
jgi:hypothetical protein